MLIPNTVIQSGGSSNQSVILAPAASTRNVIVPTVGTVIDLILKGASGQTADLLQLQDPTGNPLLIASAAGKIASGAFMAAPLAWVDLNPTLVPIAAMDVFGTTFFKLAYGGRINAEGAPMSGTDATAYFYGSQSAVKGPTSSFRHGPIVGADLNAIFRGTKAPGTYQCATVLGARSSAQDWDLTPGAVAATGHVLVLQGIEAYVSHGGANTVGSINAVYAYAEAQSVLSPANPGAITGRGITPVYAEVNVADTLGTIPAIYGYDGNRSQWNTADITLSVGVNVQNWGWAGTDTSYGIRIEDQSGSDNVYGLWVGTGKSVFTDTLLLGKTSAPADADIANSQGGWWWDEANSTPKWKGKTSGGTVVNYLPPGYELDYVESTAGTTSITATTAAAAATILTGASVTYNGSTVVLIDFYCAQAAPGLDAFIVFNLWEDSTDIGRIVVLRNPTGGSGIVTTVVGQRRLTPSAAAHVYTIKAWRVTADGSILSGSPGVDAVPPMFMRITKV